MSPKKTSRSQQVPTTRPIRSNEVSLAALHPVERFPLIVGGVDVGSNGIRGLCARFHDRNRHEVVDYERFSVRLGHDVFVSGKLSASTMESGIAALVSLRERFDRLGVRAVRAVATSAVREASNGDEFIRRAKEEAQFTLEQITGSEEARLVYLAVARRVPMGLDQYLLVDLGGGSVEVSLVDAKGIYWVESHTMGSVRLLEELSASGENPGQFLHWLDEYAHTLRIPKTDRPTGYIATGGNIETLARLAGVEPDAAGVSRLPLTELRSVVEKLAALPFARRVKELGLRPDRADVVLPAGIIYGRLGKLIAAREVIVPHVGVKDGLLFDLVSQLAPDHGEAELDHQIEESALALGRKYQFDEDHAVAVSRWSLAIFDATKELHELGPESRRILHAAALLHEIGSFVSQAGHHRHSLYLISASSLVGFSPSEMDVVANVARYHRKTMPKAGHEHFDKLSKSDKTRVRKLAGILRVADCLDRDHAQQVRSISVSIHKTSIRIETDTREEDLILERWSLRQRSDLFREVFGRKVVLESTRDN